MSVAAMEAIKPLLETVPESESFLTFDEIQAYSQELAGLYSDTLRVENIGKSEENRPLDMMVVGDIQPLDKFGPKQGRRTGVIFGVPHPNEPHGVRAAFRAAEYFAANPDKLKEFGYDTLLVLPAADVDGLVLNEGAYKGFSPLKYVKNYFRPPFDKQPEWSFPVKDRKLGLSFRKPMAVTRALMRIQKQYEPDFVGSLHNSWTEDGAYFMANRDTESLAEVIADLGKHYNIPLKTGIAEQQYNLMIAPGLYPHASRRVEARYLRDRGQKADKKGGISSYEYWMEKSTLKQMPFLKRIARKLIGDIVYDDLTGPAVVMSEIPGFVWQPNENPAHDESSGMTIHDATIAAAELQLKNVSLLQETRARMKRLPKGPRLTTVEIHEQVWNDYLGSIIQKRREEKAKGNDPEVLTKAEAFQRTHVQPLMQLLGYIGILSQLARKSGYTDEAERLDQHIESKFNELTEYGNLATRPIHEAVAMQLGGIAAAMFIKGQSLKQAA